MIIGLLHGASRILAYRLRFLVQILSRKKKRKEEAEEQNARYPRVQIQIFIFGYFLGIPRKAVASINEKKGNTILNSISKVIYFGLKFNRRMLCFFLRNGNEFLVTLVSYE